MTGKCYVIADNNVLIASGICNRSIIRNDGILEKNAVFNNRTFTDTDPAEKNTVFDRTFDDTTVSDQGLMYV